MPWTVPEYTRNEVDEAGRVLIVPDLADSLEEFEAAMATISNWRSSHAYPLNTFQMNLRKKTKLVDRRGLVAQRIKRLPAIEHKLSRMPNLRLSQMQDIGGCRAVVSSVRKVRRLRKAFVESHVKHQLVDEDDYISAPRHTGYRGIHLIYRYHSDKIEAYQRLKIELQLRTNLQHAWATAVETVGEFRKEMLKSDQGDNDWRRFFALMGTAMALRERCPGVPGTPTSREELSSEIRSHAERLEVVRHLTAYRTALSVVKDAGLRGLPAMRGKHYFLLELDPVAKTINITSYRKSQAEEAAKDYQRIERRTFSHPGPDTVLVSVDRAAALRRAYPNYFLDTRLFLIEVEKAMQGHRT